MALPRVLGMRGLCHCVLKSVPWPSQAEDTGIGRLWAGRCQVKLEAKLPTEMTTEVGW